MATTVKNPTAKKPREPAEAPEIRTPDDQVQLEIKTGTEQMADNKQEIPEQTRLEQEAGKHRVAEAKRNQDAARKVTEKADADETARTEAEEKALKEYHKRSGSRPENNEFTPVEFAESRLEPARPKETDREDKPLNEYTPVDLKAAHLVPQRYDEDVKNEEDGLKKLEVTPPDATLPDNGIREDHVPLAIPRENEEVKSPVPNVGGNNRTEPTAKRKAAAEKDAKRLVHPAVKSETMPEEGLPPSKPMPDPLDDLDS